MKALGGKPVGHEIFRLQRGLLHEGVRQRQRGLALLRQHDCHVSGHQPAAHLPAQGGQPGASALLHRAMSTYMG